MITVKAILVVVAVALISSAGAAQDDAALRGRQRSLEDANRLANAGQLYAARRITDSLVSITPGDAPDFADVLYARAAFAPSVLDASLDYEKIAKGLPPSRARSASLLRLAQRALISSDATRALDYLQRMLNDHPDEASVAEAQYWRARVLLDAHDVTAACAANHEATVHAQSSRSTLLPEIEAQGFVSCGQAPLVPVIAQPPVPATEKSTAGTAKRYAVQVSAFALRRDADAMATKLKERGVDARVDGAAKPFRVRVGHYSTYADAAKALRELKPMGISGFVSETKE